MSDTIELLEAIGSDASLRYASADELTSKLEQALASEALMVAIATGDSSQLAGEFGHKPMYTPQISQAPGHEDDEPDQEPDQEPQPAPELTK
ncbi:hypothetical protein [Dyella sp. 20L07]|uniref:hypothetical protein n=1 Tax=Dyella sp. 20L07 TaxID=3384240 RepID=UPI003D2E2E84